VQLSPQHVRSSFSTGEADGDVTHCNARVKKHPVKASLN